jgi:hypothetical protein
MYDLDKKCSCSDWSNLDTCHEHTGDKMTSQLWLKKHQLSTVCIASLQESKKRCESGSQRIPTDLIDQ